MSIKAIGEITGVWALVAGGFSDVNFADIDMAWVAAVLASLVSLKILGVWLYRLIRK